MITNTCTTKFCIKCQIETERSKRGECKPCKNATNAAWRLANPEKVKATSAAWTKANLEKVRATSAAWRSANPEKSKASSATWQEANPEKVKALQSEYRENNPVKRKLDNANWRKANSSRERANKIEWLKANPEAKRIYTQNRAAKKRENGGTLSMNLAAKLFELQQGMCPCCNQPLGDNYHMDHIMPISLGGPNIDSNIQLLKQQCNLQKSSQHPIDFMQSKGFLL